jgi:phosphocarrier protein
MTEWVGDKVMITNAVGLHARPAVKLTKFAKGFSSTVEIALHASGPWIDAKSIVRVMAMKAKCQSLLHIRARGEDGAAAVAGIVSLVRRQFDEAGQDGTGG